MKSYGRAPTFLLATGYEQARSVVAALAGDWAAARDVQLDLPETGVCNSNLPLDADRIDSGEGGCCGTPGPAGVSGDLPRSSLALVDVSAGRDGRTSCCG